MPRQVWFDAQPLLPNHHDSFELQFDCVTTEEQVRVSQVWRRCRQRLRSGSVPAYHVLPIGIGRYACPIMQFSIGKDVRPCVLLIVLFTPLEFPRVQEINRVLGSYVDIKLHLAFERKADAILKKVPSPFPILNPSDDIISNTNPFERSSRVFSQQVSILTPNVFRLQCPQTPKTSKLSLGGGCVVRGKLHSMNLCRLEAELRESDRKPDQARLPDYCQIASRCSRACQLQPDQLAGACLPSSLWARL